MDKFCGKCGSEIDKKTGLCPNCDASALEKVQEVNTKKSLEKTKRRGFSAIIALILVIAIVVSSIIFAFSKGWIGNNSEEEKKKVQTTYVTYLNKTIIPEIGKYDADHPESSNEGVHSALFCDLNNDDSDEFLVAYSKKNGSNIDFNISCYEYDEETNDPEKAEENVELIGTVIPSTEPDYTEDNDDVFHIPNETIVYSIMYENETYIVCEHMSWMNTWSYECHIYKIEQGSFVEVSNIFVPDIGTDGTRIVYSTKLPEKLVIDNSNFNVDLSDTQQYNKGVFYNEDCKVLFYKEGGNSTYIYDKYYYSEESAVADFFKCYGIENNQYHTEQDGHIAIYHPDKSDLIYSYCYYWGYDEDGNTIEKYEINDYTDWKSFLESDESDQKIETNVPDVKKIINDTASFTWNWFCYNTYTDKSKTVTKHVTESWGEADYTYALVNDPSVRSKSDIIALTQNYYTSSVTDDLMDGGQWYEENNQLYFYQSDIGDWIIDKYEIFVEKESETKYTLKTASYTGDEIIDYPHDVNLELINGNWVLDEIFAFDTKTSNVEISIIDENSDDYKKYQQYFCYLDKLLNDCNNNDMYGLYDVDKNGVLELIIDKHDSEAEAKYVFYTYNNGIVELGDVPAGYSALLIPNDKDKGLYRACSRADYYSLMLLNVNKSKIVTESIEDGPEQNYSQSKTERCFKECNSVELHQLGYEESDTLNPDIYDNLKVVLK